MSISIKIRQAYSEIDTFLELLDEEQRNEIPQKLRDFFKKEKDLEYIKNIDENIPIKFQNLREETLAIIAFLNLQYWCKDEEEKKRLKAIYSQNEKEYQNILYEKYNPNDIFKNKTTTKTNIAKEEKNQIVEYKESIFKRAINKIFNSLHFKIG